MEHETFWTLLTDAAHWEFELFLMFIFDIIIGLLVWPYISRKLQKFKKHHKEDDDKIAALEREVAALKKNRPVAPRFDVYSDKDKAAV